MEKINLYVAVEQMKRITISGGTFSIKFRKWNRQTPVSYTHLTLPTTPYV